MFIWQREAFSVVTNALPFFDAPVDLVYHVPPFVLLRSYTDKSWSLFQSRHTTRQKHKQISYNLTSVTSSVGKICSSTRCHSRNFVDRDTAVFRYPTWLLLLLLQPAWVTLMYLQFACRHEPPRDRLVTADISRSVDIRRRTHDCLRYTLWSPRELSSIPTWHISAANRRRAPSNTCCR